MSNAVLAGDVLAKRGMFIASSLDDFPIGMSYTEKTKTANCPYNIAMVLTMSGSSSIIQKVYNLSDATEFKMRIRYGDADTGRWTQFATYKAN